MKKVFSVKLFVINIFFLFMIFFSPFLIGSYYFGEKILRHEGLFAELPFFVRGYLIVVERLFAPSLINIPLLLFLIFILAFLLSLLLKDLNEKRVLILNLMIGTFFVLLMGIFVWRAVEMTNSALENESIQNIFDCKDGLCTF